MIEYLSRARQLRDGSAVTRRGIVVARRWYRCGSVMASRMLRCGSAVARRKLRGNSSAAPRLLQNGYAAKFRKKNQKRFSKHLEKILQKTMCGKIFCFICFLKIILQKMQSSNFDQCQLGLIVFWASSKANNS